MTPHSALIELLAAKRRTAAELAEVLDADLVNVHASLRALRCANKRRGRLVFIAAWRQLRGPSGRLAWTPVYAAGDKPDAKRPDPDPRAAWRRYYHGTASRPTSVFDTVSASTRMKRRAVDRKINNER